MLALATGLGVIVVALLTIAVARGVRARRRGLPPSPVRGSVPWELTYTAIPVLLVGGVFAMSLLADRAIADASDPDEVVAVDVVAFQWGWSFDYGGGRVERGQSGERPDLVLPVDRTARLRLVSRDVVHSLWVPELGTKLDLIPGRVNTLEVTPTREGEMLGHCAEFCGLDHAAMNFTLRVVDDDAFERWLELGDR